MISLNDAPQASDLLFVYGTLLSGLSNHHHMRGAACLGPATVQGALFSLGEYPALLVSGALSAPLVPVAGELYKIEAAHWAHLDALEEVDPHSVENSMYLRQTVAVQWQQGQALQWVKAQVYVYNWSLEGRERFAHGDFRRHVSGS